MRNKECVIPCISFMETGTGCKVCSFFGIERFIKPAFLRNGTKSTKLFAEIILITHGTFAEQLGIFFLSQFFSQSRQRIICHIIFQGMRNRIIILAFHRHISLCHIVIIIRAHQVILTRGSGRLIHSFICQVDVEVLKTFHPTVHDNRNRRIAFHCQCLTSVKFPFGKPSMFLIHAEHGMNHIHLALRIH